MGKKGKLSSDPSVSDMLDVELHGLILKDTDSIVELSTKKIFSQADKDHLKATALNLKKNIEDLLKLKTASSVMELSAMLEKLDQKVETLMTQPSAAATQFPTFAQAASNNNNKNNIDKKIEENTIIIKSNSKPDTNNLQNTVFDEIKKMRTTKNNSKVNKIIRTKTGVIVKVPVEEDIDKLIEDFKKLDNINSKAQVFKAKPLDPTVILNRVSKMTDYASLPNTIALLNPELNNKQDEIRVISHSDRNRNNQNVSHTDVILRVSPDVYQIIKKSKHIFIDYECVTWRDKIMVKQCQNCFTFNPDHKKQECKHARHCYCGKVGEHQCDKSTKCVNCSKHPNFANLPNNHKPNSSNCPLYKAQERHIIDKTCYKPNCNTGPPLPHGS